MLAILNRNQTAGLFGLDVQPEGVCLVHVVPDPRRRPRVLACECREASDADSRAAALARLASDYGLKRARCTTVLSPGQYKLLLTEAPAVQPEELKAAIRWRIKDLIDFHINDATVDVFDVPALAGPGQVRPMYAVVARNQTIQERVDQLDAAAVNLAVIDVPELALRNVSALLPEDAQGVALLWLYESGGMINVTKQGELYLSRGIEIGLDALRADAPHALDHIALEIQRSLDYYDSHFRQAPINHVFVAPPPAEVPGLIERLGANLNPRVQYLDLTGQFDWAVSVPAPLQARCLRALGAALRQEASVL